MSTSTTFQAPQTPELLSDFPQFRYLPYPHCNGFVEGGKSIVLGRSQDPTLSLWQYDLATGKDTKLCSFARGPEPEKLLWFDVAEKTDQLALVAENSFWIMEISRPDSLRRVYQAPPGHGAFGVAQRHGRRKIYGRFNEISRRDLCRSARRERNGADGSSLQEIVVCPTCPLLSARRIVDRFLPRRTGPRNFQAGLGLARRQGAGGQMPFRSRPTRSGAWPRALVLSRAIDFGCGLWRRQWQAGRHLRALSRRQHAATGGRRLSRLACGA